MVKAELHQKCLDLLQEKVKALSLAVNDAQNAANNESKSSAGDKHETGREMARQEVDKLGNQLMAAEKAVELAIKTNLDNAVNVVSVGSLVHTNNGIFYLLVAIGKISFEKQDVFVLSANSPLGQQLIGKNLREKFSFMEKAYEITAIL